MRELSLLFTNLYSTLTNENQKTIVDCFREQLKKSDSLDIVVGYCSKASLEELDKLISQQGIKNICLILGMYYFEGFPKTLYETIIELNEKWMQLNIGEIRAIYSFKYHGKLYCFYNSQKPISAILGSANFSFLDEIKQKQYEIATLFTNKEMLQQILNHIREMKREDISQNITYLKGINLVEDKQEDLKNIEIKEFIKETKTTKQTYTFKPKSIFYLPLKVPLEKNRFNPDRSNYTKSNLNACYGQPRTKEGAPRNWWEMQITVSKKIISQKGYPKRRKWFYVITDDGYKFKAHTVGANGKQFAAAGDEKLLGRWIKGKLVSLGIVKPIEDVSLDIDKKGMITKEMLEEYGGDKLILMNTGKKKIDEDGISRSIWFLSFPRKT